MVEPLFKSEGSVYRRSSPLASSRSQDFETDDDDEDWVDRSIPSTPVDDRFEDPLGPGTSSSRARSRTPMAPNTDLNIKREPEVDSWHTVKEESLDQDRSRDETPSLREIDPDDMEEMDAPPEDERQCRICFAGKEEEGTMGRLISPCLCTGSVRVSLMPSRGVNQVSRCANISVCTR